MGTLTSRTLCKGSGIGLRQVELPNNSKKSLFSAFCSEIRSSGLFMPYCELLAELRACKRMRAPCSIPPEAPSPASAAHKTAPHVACQEQTAHKQARP